MARTADTAGTTGSASSTRRRRPSRWAPVALAVALAVTGCGGSGDASTPTSNASGKTPTFEDRTGSAEVEVVTTDNLYTPAFIEVRPGTKVTFVNSGRANHNVRPDEPGAFTPIETAALEPGMSASITFDEEGEYGFHCSLHGAPGRVQYGIVKVVRPTS